MAGGDHAAARASARADTAAPRPRHPATPDWEGFKGCLQQDAHGREAAQDQLFRRSGVLSGRLERGVEKGPGRQGVERRAKVEERKQSVGGGMNRRGQGDMNVAAIVMMMSEGRLAAVIGHVDRHGLIGDEVVIGCFMAVFMAVPMVMMLIMIMGQIGRVLIGDAGELKAVFDAMLAVHHAMHLHRDHDGHAQADAEEAEQAWQIEIPR